MHHTEGQSETEIVLKQPFLEVILYPDFLGLVLLLDWNACNCNDAYLSRADGGTWDYTI